MNKDDQDLMKKLLQLTLPPVDANAEPGRDLWPTMLRRLDEEPAAQVSTGWAWVDGALLAGIVGLAALVPAAIPVFLYCL